MYRRVWSEIDLRALRHNVRVLASRLAGVDLWGVVKADAYGHGAAQVSRTLEEEGVAGLAVASLDEALVLREAGVGAPVLVLGETPPEGVGLLQRHGISQCLFRPEHLEGWGPMLDPSLPPPAIHVKVDSGMHRLGVPPGGLAPLSEEFSSGPFTPAGVFTHFGMADMDEAATRDALDSFLAGLDQSSWLERWPTCRRHAGNSAAVLLGPAYWLDGVRLGTLVYGVAPPGSPREATPSVLPVMGVHAHVVDLKTVAAGEGFGYGEADLADKPRRLGVVPIGYADGYLRRLSGRAHALVRGARAPVVGAVSMDFLHLDLSAVPEAKVGDRVTLVGAQGEETVSLADLAAWADTIPYEMMTLLGKRAPRVFLASEAASRA